MTAEPDAVCDGGDLDCGSGLLLIIRSAMAPLAPGGTLLVKSREVSVREDLPAWCRMVGHALLAATAADAGYTHYLLRKKAADDTLARDLQRAREHVWQARVCWAGGMQAKVAVRNHRFLVGQPASFDTEDAAPSAVEYLLAAVGGALATGLQWRLSRLGVEVRNLEVVAKARSRDALVFLGVDNAGERAATAVPSDAALDGIDVVVYVDAELAPPELDAVLQETLRRCPVTQTLLQAVPVRTQARPV